ncbi:MAG TPA: hypothetical protein VEY69_18250 [Lautropia sp.]|nr:hypothetical protein [Lautropia sp.]
MADSNNLAPGAGSTVSGSTTSSAGGTGSSPATGSSSFSDTSRPTGSTTSSSTQSAGGGFSSSGTEFQPDTNYRQSQDYGSETASYQPSGEVTYAPQSRSRPSTAVIAGAALAGAITGGAIPFLLAGRKSSPKAQFSVDGDRGDDFEGRESRPALFSKTGFGKQR